MGISDPFKADIFVCPGKIYPQLAYFFKEKFCHTIASDLLSMLNQDINQFIIGFKINEEKPESSEIEYVDKWAISEAFDQKDFWKIA